MQITELNGVGPKTAALLKKLKIETVEDLFLHYPRRYETHPAPVPISQIVENQKCAVQCVVKKEAVKGNYGLMTLFQTAAGALPVNGSKIPGLIKS